MTLQDEQPTSLDQQHYGSLDSNAPTTVAAAEFKRESQDATQNEKQQIAQANPNAPTGLKFALILVALYAAVFLVALDRTILATAVPKITSHFHSLGDISWYASVYLITSCATQPLWGRIYTFHSTKLVFIIAIIVFEVGSVVCAAAPTSKAFIVGRAIAGLGSGGIFAGSTVILTFLIPLEKRPMYISILGTMFGVASILGPLLGGAFTDKVSWRWCFYINLPIGGAALAVVVPFLQVNDPKNTSATFAQQIMRLDPIGQTFFLPAIVCLIVAMQWGGSTYTWSDHRVIALFVVSGVLLIIFVGVQIWRQDDATLPPRVMKQRSLSLGAVFAFCLGGGLISMLYSLAIWFQAVKGTSAVQSGVDSLATVLALVVGTIISGTVVEKTGYYVPWMIAAGVFMSIGAGLITTFEVHTNHAMWIGYQVLFGLGLGVGMQQPSLAAQTVLEDKDVSIGVSLMFFCQSLGGAIFVASAQAIFNSFLGQGLSHIQGIDAQKIIYSGATNLAANVPHSALDAVLSVYNTALVKSFYVPVAISALMVIPALFMEWRTIKADAGIVEVS